MAIYIYLVDAVYNHWRSYTVSLLRLLLNIDNYDDLYKWIYEYDDIMVVSATLKW